MSIIGPLIYPGLVIWDPGPSEKWRSAGLSGQLFTVPGGATVGTHVVQREVAGVRGSQATFTVDEIRPFPKPRVDRVSLVAAEFKAGNTVSTLLYVQGANVDVGATIELGESESGVITWKTIPTTAHRGLSNRGWDVTLSLPYGALDYPVYHFLTFVAVAGERPAGDALPIRIRNEDGSVSDPVRYTLPLTAATLDSDGDGIPDALESSYDARYRPDILVQVDHMADAAKPLQHPWSHNVAVALQEVFAAAPIITPFGPNGINLVVDDAQAIPSNVAVQWDGPEDLTVLEGACTAANIGVSDRSMLTLKRACFNNTARGSYWHYCVWAGDTYLKDEAGNKSPLAGIGEIGGDDCIVAADYYASAWMNDVRTEAEVLMHELGHNLGLRHGGGDDATHNPTHNSVMSYSWLGRNHWVTNDARKSFPVCTTLYYQLAAASSSEIGGAAPAGADPNQFRGYSDGMGRALPESNLDEKPATPGSPYGVCNNALDWDCAWSNGASNCNGSVSDLHVTRDLNNNSITTDILTDYPEWIRLVFDGPARNGTLKLVSDPP